MAPNDPLDNSYDPFSSTPPAKSPTPDAEPPALDAVPQYEATPPPLPQPYGTTPEPPQAPPTYPAAPQPAQPYPAPGQPSPWAPPQSPGPPPPYPGGAPFAPPGYGQPAQPSPGYYTESANAGTVLTIGVLSIFILQLVLGPVALFLGRRGARLIDEGKASPADRTSLTAGRICGAIGTVVGVVVTGLFVAGMVVGYRSAHESYAQARAGFQTHLAKQTQNNDPLPTPPAGFSIVHYQDPLGSFPAIVADPDALGTASGGKHPAIIWLTGGFSNEIGDDPWTPATPDDDQSGSAFYKAGIVEMYPSRRGGNGNAGYVETFYGEVDDVLAAEKYLAAQPNVDPKRIYLGGHSTGGTLALLTAAASSGQFRAVFCFGPAADTLSYGTDSITYDPDDYEERRMRAPIHWLSSIHSPTWVIEGDTEPSNIEPLRLLEDRSSNPNLHFVLVPGSDHFGELARTTPVIAKKIVEDTSAQCHIDVSTRDWP